MFGDPVMLTWPALTLTPPSAPLRGQVAVPGSKSVTNRVLLLAALAKGRSRLTGALKSDDTGYMAEALRAMGVQVSEPDATSFLVESDGTLHAPAAPLFLGNAGTATRFLTAAAALADGPVVIDGDRHMRTRPIAPLLEALGMLGISAKAPSGCPPVTVLGQGGVHGGIRRSFRGGRAEVDAGLSSQYVSALLMLAPCGHGTTEIALRGNDIGARGYIDLTLAAMRRFGVDPERTAPGQWSLSPGGYHAADVAIEPDASAATYLWAAAALTGGAIDIGMDAASFSQPDAKSYALITAFPEMPPVIDGAQMQDAIPTLAVMAAFNRTPVRFTGIANLRVKECDRVHALAVGLSQIHPGLGREEGDDLVVASQPTLAGQSCSARIDTFADHRIAMSFALAGLLVEGITILDPGCVAKTYPGFWDMLAGLGVALHPAA